MLDHMVRQGWGRIVLISARPDNVNDLHNVECLGGIHGLMRSVARNYAEFGTTVNEVQPCKINETESAMDFPYRLENIPVRRPGLAREVANVVLTFCRTGFMTGQTVEVAGGLGLT